MWLILNKESKKVIQILDEYPNDINEEKQEIVEVNNFPFDLDDIEICDIYYYEDGYLKECPRDYRTIKTLKMLTKFKEKQEKINEELKLMQTQAVLNTEFLVVLAEFNNL